MSRSIFPFLLFVFACTLWSCQSSQPAANPKEDKALLAFADLLIGEFSSEAQSKSDSDYYHISLSMTRIWEEKNDAIYLYVEQAMAAKKDKPYRQRVYKLNHPAKNVFTSEIYTIKGPENFVDLSHDASKQAALTQDLIEFKEGCTVTMTLKKGVYTGGTDADKCPSDLRGASYATTQITLKKGLLVSWDQGFDKSGKQVWGATKGGYQFVKQ
ncbi:MAG: chromophore lyase CpcT/CpeT [Flavobacteriales bacterium]